MTTVKDALAALVKAFEASDGWRDLPEYKDALAALAAPDEPSADSRAAYFDFLKRNSVPDVRMRAFAFEMGYREGKRSREPKNLSTLAVHKGWEATFSTNNPFCPCDLKSFTKAVNWALRQ